ncbi:hypothetical protein TNCV_788641 [Trichonephila clavipes]|nr:hypothetical protein TNCV_788641 [Trichonephila clavipes]
MRNLPFRRTQRPKSNKIIPCKTISGPPAVLTGEGIKLPCVFEAVREIYRNIFGFASFEKVDHFRSEIQLAGHPLRGISIQPAQRPAELERIPTPLAQRPAEPERPAELERIPIPLAQRPAESERMPPAKTERPPMEMVDPSVSVNTVEVTPPLITRCDKSTQTIFPYLHVKRLDFGKRRMEQPEAN